MTISPNSVRIERISKGRYLAHNGSGASIPIGGDEAFSPVELLLAALGSCTAVDTDIATSRRTEPTSFTVTVSGDKVAEEETGNRMKNLTVTFSVEFPEGQQGDEARTLLPRTVALSHNKLCTVSRTVELGTPVRTVIE
ncbi:OsmC family protein [Saccharomonospora sp.]|uniref:OsmC family protein n=1 Tax=Saccharomonospora sp. TaxID=33913 RepID=UPI0026204159|nr:OsmC family protein [Saccharomonospora sp.]